MRKIIAIGCALLSASCTSLSEKTAYLDTSTARQCREVDLSFSAVMAAEDAKIELKNISAYTTVTLLDDQDSHTAKEELPLEVQIRVRDDARIISQTTITPDAGDGWWTFVKLENGIHAVCVSAWQGPPA